MKTKMYRLFLALALLLLPALGFAQAAAELDGVLGADTVSAAAAARFVLGAAGLLPEGLTGTEAENAAWETASSKGWIKTAADDPVTLKEAAFLVMNAFELRGGVMYSLLPGPRYAYREMLYRKIIHGDPDTKVSGPALLLILDRTQRYTDGGAQ